MTWISHRNTAVRLLAATILGIEATTACAAAIGPSGGAVIAGSVMLPEGAVAAYAIWLINAMLAILRGQHARMALGATAFIIAAAALVGPLPAGQSSWVFGVAAMLTLLAFAVQPRDAAAPAAAPLPHTRFPR